MKAIIVGRHQLSGKEGLEVISQENINFPATSDECHHILFGLLEKAKEAEAALIFQALPGQLAIACANIINEDVGYHIGVIVNVPGKRESGIEVCYDLENVANFQRVEAFAKALNPRAKIKSEGANKVLAVVDPPLRFKFSHIEWFG